MKFYILNISALALLIGGWLQGSVAAVFSDGYHLTWVVAAVFLYGLWRARVAVTTRKMYVAPKAWDDVSTISDWLVRIGLLFTVIGLSIAFVGVTGQEDISLRDLGAATALLTTLVGLTGSLWLELMRWLFE
jgi:hypothetical protein